MISIKIYKEKKKKDFRIIIFPTGKNRQGLTQIKDYGIVTYLDKNNIEKIGEFILWAKKESDNKVFENKSEEEFSKRYFNVSSIRKIAVNYNLVNIIIINGIYQLELKKKDGHGFSPFKDEDGNSVEYEFKEEPSPYELGLKVMEMFEYKERYDGLE